MSQIDTPNLFTYATSELSQDAVLAYTLAWADPKHASTEGKMHRIGQEFVRLLLGLHEIKGALDITEVEVKAQHKNIDVIARIDTDRGTFVLVIEDKIHAGSYNDLPKYLAAAAGETYPDTELLGIYLRTGSQANYRAIEDEGFQVLDRAAFLAFLDSKSCDGLSNAILLEYRRHLHSIESAYNAYQDSAITTWNGTAWVGFYHKKLIPNDSLYFGDYGYISNPQGGFNGCWWTNAVRKEFDGYPVYLQLEEATLTFKVGPVEDKAGRTALARKLSKHIVTQVEDANPLGIYRPLRLSPGKYMTVAKVDLIDHLGTDAEYNDVLKYLQQVQNFYFSIL